jgi:hypothetical protein
MVLSLESGQNFQRMTIGPIVKNLWHQRACNAVQLPSTIVALQSLHLPSCCGIIMPEQKQKNQKARKTIMSGEHLEMVSRCIQTWTLNMRLH